ncbi:hypothetical protein [Rhizobium sp. BR 315]|uniref:hypothetical protein n=1 Tax=Rhizobium sp. BR 315 TaxID=3040014 RepID=UPI003D341EEE
MNQTDKLPSAFECFRKMLGVLDFVVFEDADGTDEEILSAIPQALQPSSTIDIEKLRLLGRRCISDKEFFGDWYDLDGGQLLKLGRYRTSDGSELHNPILNTLDNVNITSGGGGLPEVGAGGQFAYAFSWTPYSLRARPSEVQTAFEEIRDFILPPLQTSEIFDWSNVRLPEVSDYFDAGADWWGVFLFSVYIPSLRRLTIIAGSTTD